MNREQYQTKAGIEVRKAVALGIIIKPERCSNCNAKVPLDELEGHHHDYSKPLEVEWLCKRCHRKTHRMLRWFAVCYDWLKYCSEQNMDPREGRLPALHAKTGIPLKITQFEYWLTYLRKKR